MSLRVGVDEFLRPDGRYHRQSLMAWWDQERVARSNLLVVGAGALGNEILKNLALMGAGQVLLYDMDRVAHSNLSRGVLFREEDEGDFKADVAVRRMRELNKDVNAVAHTKNLVHGAGLGVFAWADVVICGVDNREARLFINSACARTGRTWIDGAIEGLSGVVRAFRPHEGVCYECTMNETDHRLVAERRSCAMLAKEVIERGHVPTTAVAASIVGALQVQEALKVVHDQPALVGEGLHIHGLWGDVSRVKYPRRDECAGHDHLGPLTPLGLGHADETLGALLTHAEQALGRGAVLDLSRDVVTGLTCPDCESAEPRGAVLGSLTEADAACPRCGTHRIVETTSSIGRDSGVNPALTPADIGLPPFDIIVARQGLSARLAWLFDADAPAVLKSLTDPGGSGASERSRHTRDRG